LRTGSERLKARHGDAGQDADDRDDDHELNQAEAGLATAASRLMSVAQRKKPTHDVSS
jgi:hypothetical protein